MTSLSRLALVLLLVSLAPAPLLAQCTGTGECVMPPGSCAYVGTDIAFYGFNHAEKSLILENSNGCDPLPALNGFFNTSFDAVATVALSSDGGLNYFTYGAPAHLVVHVLTTGQVGNDKTIQTELLAMDIAGGSLPAGTRLRESPVLASNGQGQSAALGGGQFTITSFFDVFTELSLDNGQNWFPGSAPIHLTLQQGPPLPTRVQTWGGVKAIYR